MPKSKFTLKAYEGGSKIQLAEGDKAPSKIQLLRVGSFKSEEHGSLAITKEHLASMARNFAEKARGYDDGHLPIDYFHENEKIAAGWIENVALTEDGTELWADVIWTPRGAQHVTDKELRYVSAEFHFDYKSNEGGKKFGPTLFGAGLTNRPFIKGMEAVVELSEGDGTMTLEQALAKIAELEAKIAAMGGSENELADLKKKLADVEAEKMKAAEVAKLNEKKGKFDKMLAEGRVCEAQRKPFMDGDSEKFAEAAQPMKLSDKGSSQGADENGDDSKKFSKSETPAQDEVQALAEVEVKGGLKFSEAVQKVLRAKPELAEKYNKEVSVR